MSYTGTGATATVGHGLGAVPKMIIVKDRDASANWNTYHVANGNANTVQLKDRKSTRLNSSHTVISYAVFCLKKKTKKKTKKKKQKKSREMIKISKCKWFTRTLINDRYNTLRSH